MIKSYSSLKINQKFVVDGVPRTTTTTNNNDSEDFKLLGIHIYDIYIHCPCRGPCVSRMISVTNYE